MTEEARPSRGRHRPGASGSWRPSTCRARCRACSRSGRPDALRGGFEAASKRYGLPIEYLDARFVNDHCYMRMRPVGAPEPKPGKASSPPPRFVMWALARLHPELRRRARTARAVLAERRWHDDLHRWESGLRDEMLQIGRALQAEDLTAMGDDELIDHLGRVADHMVRGFNVHFDLMLVHNIPLGRLVAACRTWGISDADALGLLAGELAASAGSPRRCGASPTRAGRPGSSRRRSTTSATPAPRPVPPSTSTWPTTPGAP